MNRRIFLKSLAAACGAAVVCPGELVKGKSEREILLEKFRAAALNTKNKNDNPVFGKGKRSEHIYMIDHPVFHNTVHTMHNFGGRYSGYVITRSA